MKQNKWIVPVVVGMLSLSLVGCSNTGMEPMSEAARSTQSGDGMTATAVNPPRTSADNYMRTGVDLSTGEEMLDNARYYADGDGALEDDGAQKGCKDCHRDRHHMGEDLSRDMREGADRVESDVEQALRDVGRTMDSMRTDL